MNECKLFLFIIENKEKFCLNSVTWFCNENLLNRGRSRVKKDKIVKNRSLHLDLLSLPFISKGYVGVCLRRYRSYSAFSLHES